MISELDESNAFELGREKIGRVISEINKVLYGLDEQILLILVAMLSRGHVLLEAEPGTAKTMTARALARTIHGVFKRISMGPEILPSDIVGTEIYHQKVAEYLVRVGKISRANIVLIDEVNRANQKANAAFLEPLEEGHITLGSIAEEEVFALPQPNFFIFTKNPIEQRGTNPLPEALLDRIMFEIKFPVVESKYEIAMLSNPSSRLTMDERLEVIEPVLHPAEILTIRAAIMNREKMFYSDSLIKYISQLVRELREHPDREAGISWRCSLDLLRAAVTYAYLQGSDWVKVDHVQKVAIPALAHRLFLKEEAVFDGRKARHVVEEVLRGLKHESR